jgi:hypothetical protein
MWMGRGVSIVVGVHTGTLEVPMTTTTSTRHLGFGGWMFAAFGYGLTRLEDRDV